MATKKPSTDVAVKPSANLVSIKETLKAQAAAMAERTAPPGGNVIRLSPGKFTLPDGTTTPGPLQLVIIDFVSKNAYYPEGYNPKNIVPPTCFAIGANIKTMVPSKSSPVNQNPGKDCATCPQNAWESDPKGGKGKACKNSRVLAVLPPDAEEDSPIWLLNVSPTATKGFDALVTGVARVFEQPPISVIVTVGLNPGEDYPQLVFSDPIPNENIAVHFPRQAEAMELLLVEPDVSSYVPPTKAKASGRR